MSFHNKQLRRQIIRLQNDIRKRYKALKNQSSEVQRSLENRYNPLIIPIKKLTDVIKSGTPIIREYPESVIERDYPTKGLLDEYSDEEYIWEEEPLSYRSIDTLQHNLSAKVSPIPPDTFSSDDELETHLPADSIKETQEVNNNNNATTATSSSKILPKVHSNI